MTSVNTSNPPSDPTIDGAVLDTDDADGHWLDETRDRAMQAVSARVPARYADATVTVPEVADWVRALVAEARDARTTVPRIVSGPSLLLLGGTGTGKTHQAFGAVRALAASGAVCPWQVITAADLYASLRPRPGVDPETVFDGVARVALLVLDDLGAAKGSEWTEEITFRLINARYEHQRPTLITSNVQPRELAAALGERVASRLVEMAARVVLRGPDRRLTAKTGDAA